jgi:Protein of unknown function (DUF732)/Family of unknown function (DUF5313)
MTHIPPSPSIAHPDPARWLWHTFGGRLGSRYCGWVLRDTTTRTRWLREAVRGGVPCGQSRRAMAAQRRYRRFMGLALTSGPLLVAGVVWASPAQADAASFLNDMHNVGIHDVGGDAALLQVGQKLCDETWDGYPPAELAAMALHRSDTIRRAHGLTPQQANEFVYYAKADLCPNY